MTITTHQANLTGQKLHRLILSPTGPVKGGLIFFHGQGDYIDKYPDILKPFVEAGYRCLLTDLPGHGRSPGKRGEVPSIEIIEELFQSSLRILPQPTIIAGHSMGGLLALHFLLSYPEKFTAAWISSPLLDPMRQAKPWMRHLLPIISKITPWLTVGTGVQARDCGDDPKRGSEEEKPLYHSRISLGWGLDLRNIAEKVSAQFLNFPTELPTLFTQGNIDPICPADILRERLTKLPKNQITYQEIPEALHEPFSGSSQEEFLARLRNWLTQKL